MKIIKAHVTPQKLNKRAHFQHTTDPTGNPGQNTILFIYILAFGGEVIYL